MHTFTFLFPFLFSFGMSMDKVCWGAFVFKKHSTSSLFIFSM